MKHYKTLETMSDYNEPNKMRNRMSVNNELNDITDTIIYVKDLEHRKSIINTKKPTVVYYSTDWCQPCKIFALDFAKFSIRYPSIFFLKEDADLFLDTPVPITGVPCLHFYKDGTFISKMTIVGINNKLFEDALNTIQ
jgi:thiol-disulfide isomerase/thioredoxin